MNTQTYFVIAKPNIKFLPRGTTLFVRLKDAQENLPKGHKIMVAHCPTKRTKEDTCIATCPVQILKEATPLKSIVKDLMKDFDPRNPQLPPVQRKPHSETRPQDNTNTTSILLPKPLEHPDTPYYQSSNTSVTGFDYGFQIKHHCPDCSEVITQNTGSLATAMEAARLFDEQSCKDHQQKI